MVIGNGYKDGFVSEEEASQIVSQAVEKADIRGKRVLAIIPDHTRTAPVGLFFRLFCEHFGTVAKKLDFMIALGTHPPLSDERINEHLGISAEERKNKYASVNIYNHSWDQPETLQEIGTISADEIEEISNGLFSEDVRVSINKRIFDYDTLMICGPTFPHEVVGFSGGNKYLFPGISGPDVLNFFHWLGAVITNAKINGTKETPVRDVVNRAASLVSVPRICFSLVVTPEGLRGVYFGSPEEAYSAAADLSSHHHIVFKDRMYSNVLGIAPEMYDDIWTAGKVMYKLEPILAEGADLIIYAPHITEISYTHGKLLDKIGYHVRDYFIKQWDKFADIPRGVTAHSTHVKGLGVYEDGVECPRANVILATQIPEERCRKVNLGYMDPSTIDPSEWEGKEDEGVLLVRKAGEFLHRLDR